MRTYDYDNDNDFFPALVDPALEIDADSPDYAGEQMGYWPNYSHISPQCRAAYLEWLASDRNDPEAYIGYIFLYFYGIERRLLVDDANGEVSDDERKALIQELQRLKIVYSDNRSFDAYATGLLSHAWVINHQDDNEQPDYNLLVTAENFTFLLAKTVQNGKPVNAELALAWVRSLPGLTLRMPARRCSEEFDALFKLRYKDKFGDGLKIKANKTRLQLDYLPASLSLRGYQRVKFDLPDVSRLAEPVKELMTLAESCTGELDSFSRFVGRPHNSHKSWHALSLLPSDLIASSVINQQTSIFYSHFERLKAWIKTQVHESDGLVSVEPMLQYFGENVSLHSQVE